MITSILPGDLLVWCWRSYSASTFTRIAVCISHSEDPHTYMVMQTFPNFMITTWTLRPPDSRLEVFR